MTYSRIYDSTTPFEIPEGKLMAWYTNGTYGPGNWTYKARKRSLAGFGIAAHPNIDGEEYCGAARLARALDIGDVGDGTYQDAVPWIKKRMSHGHRDATLYVSLHDLAGCWPMVQSTPGLVYRLWLATGDGNMHPEDQFADYGIHGAPKPWAVQYLWPYDSNAPPGRPHSKGHYDVSVLYGENDLTRV